MPHLIRKIRFLESGNRPYRPSLFNLAVYDRTIRNPSLGLMTLATIAHREVTDVKMYSESISRILWDDVLDADLVCIGIFTFNAMRGYELADYVRAHSNAVVVMGGLHASLNHPEAAWQCDYVLLGEGDESILEVIRASSRIYSFKRLLSALVHKRGLERLLFIGEFLWQRSVRSDLKKELSWLKRLSTEEGGGHERF